MVSDVERDKWLRAAYPYDVMPGCYACITYHATYVCTNADHQQLAGEARKLNLNSPGRYAGTTEQFRSAVTKLRKKYARLFPAREV